MIYVSIPKESSSGNSYKVFQLYQVFVFLQPHQCFVFLHVNILYEIPDYDSFAIGTYNVVECSSLKNVCLIRMFYFVCRENCNTVG